jgi:hypothetical protein
MEPMRTLVICSFLSLTFACTGTLSGSPAESAPEGEATAPDAKAPNDPVASITPPTSTEPGDPPSIDPEPVTPETLPGPPVYLSAGIRRLSQAEVSTAAAALLGVPASDLATAIGSDLRQSGFTRNADQRVGSVQAEAMWRSVPTLVHEAVSTRLAAIAPCATTPGTETCAQTFIHAFGARAFRRALSAAEESALRTVYRTGATDATYAEGIELTITAMLQSASFLYVTELGRSATDATTTLAGDELATQLSLLFTGAPASEQLMAKGLAGMLDTPDGREQAARELLTTPEAKAQLERLMLEWTGVDSVDQAGKDSGLFPEWPDVKSDVLSESRSIIDSVLFEGDGTLRSMLSTSQTNVTPTLAAFYGLTGSGPMVQPAYRRGLLLAGGFAAANSHFTDTAPIRRAAMVRKKLLCQELPLPSAAGLTITVPAADPTLTTRERFSVHSQDATCSGCHKMLDPIGFALESFDAVGRYRTTENGKPIDPSGSLLNAGDAEGDFTDAVGLTTLLAGSKTVSQCFQHQLFRFASGRSGVEEERTWLDFVRARPSGSEGKIVELLIDYARSDSFALRRNQ